MTDDDISCDTCSYWARLDDGEHGECRLHAPRPRNTTSTDTHWPVTTEDDWCGEWDNSDIDDDDDSDDLVDEVFDDIVERLTLPARRRWWRRGAA